MPLVGIDGALAYLRVVLAPQRPTGQRRLGAPVGTRDERLPRLVLGARPNLRFDPMEVNPNLSEKAQYDYALVLRATKEKDQKAYAELMQRYEGAIFHLINRMVFSEDDAEDLTIETFTKAFKRLNQYTPAFAFSTWLFKIASNHTIDFIRKKRIKALSLDRGFTNSEGDQLEISVKDDGLDPMEALQKQERIERMREVVAQLKDRYRRLVELRYFEEKSYEEISEELNLPLGTVKAQLFRARDMMAKVLESSRETI